MSDPMQSEIRIFGFNYPPRNYSTCKGQQVSISEHQALYSLLDTAFGGDGRSTFNLPDFRGRVPVGRGQGPGMSHEYRRGEASGSEFVVLQTPDLPAHKHSATTQTGGGGMSLDVPATSVSVTQQPTVDVTQQPAISANVKVKCGTTPNSPNPQGKVWANDEWNQHVYGNGTGGVMHANLVDIGVTLNQPAATVNNITATTQSASVGVTGVSGTLSIGNTGSSRAHSNMQPYLVLNICIAMEGTYPSRS